MRLRLNRKYLKTIQGHSLTSQRHLLLELIGEAHGHIDAKELYQRAINRGESISLATLYRSLNLFKQLDLIDEHHIGRGCRCYEIKQAIEHQHTVCKCCGKVFDFKSNLIRKLVDEVQREQGFDVSSVTLCLEGCCEQCRKKAIPVKKLIENKEGNNHANL
ncbi:MAG: transcriptional repressor [Dehalococcoidia bacterium]|nr:transcriptional repressor [Dehalococcoidia bacterium]